MKVDVRQLEQSDRFDEWTKLNQLYEIGSQTLLLKEEDVRTNPFGIFNHFVFDDESGILKQLYIFVDSSVSPQKNIFQKNNYMGVLHTVAVNLVESSIGYATINCQENDTPLSPIQKRELLVAVNRSIQASLRKAKDTIYDVMLRNHNPHELTFEDIMSLFRKEAKNAIKQCVRDYVGDKNWNTDKFYEWASKHRLNAEIIAITHFQGEISYLDYQSGSKIGSHFKGQIEPPNCTSSFEFQFHRNGSVELINTGMTIASPSSSIESNRDIIRRSFRIAAEKYLGLCDTFGVDSTFFLHQSDGVPNFVTENKDDSESDSIHASNDKPVVYILHNLLTTPHALKNDGQGKSWREELLAFSEVGGSINAGSYVVKPLLICSGVNDIWGDKRLTYGNKSVSNIVEANQGSIDTILSLLKSSQIDRHITEVLRGLITQFTDPSSKFYYMNDAGNALRFNQVLYRACKSLGIIYITGCKSGNDRTYLQRVFNAACSGSPNPELVAAFNTIFDTNDRPKSHPKKLGGASRGMEVACTHALEREIDDSHMLQSAVHFQRHYQKTGGGAFHKKQREGANYIRKEFWKGVTHIGKKENKGKFFSSTPPDSLSVETTKKGKQHQIHSDSRGDLELESSMLKRGRATHSSLRIYSHVSDGLIDDSELEESLSDREDTPVFGDL